MNNPFDYNPSEAMLKQQSELISRINLLCQTDSAFCEEVSKGKMFGILITDGGVLYAYSGQICGRSDWQGFVPAVFDYLQDDGYFKTHEALISAVNKEIASIEESHERAHAHALYKEVSSEAEKEIEDYKLLMKASKLQRDILRNTGGANPADLVRESQYMKAELHRKKQKWAARMAEAEAKVNDIEGRIRSLKMRRQHDSDALQRWLFEQFVFTSLNGEKRNLLQIWEAQFVGVSSVLPPAGSGECCEPKLLHYAIAHGLKPLEMGMFWWGESPRQEVRHHLHFYPACNGKCKPILQFLLAENSHFEAETTRNSLQIIYEDDTLVVVNKPAGMLSVPGKGTQPSVFSVLHERLSDCHELQMVHRLDMDTSGLLVVAKTKQAHKHLQRQFAEHTNSKTYIALLEQPLEGEGEIHLSLRPDYDDRPRQMVDHKDGKPAHTHWRALGGNRVELTLFTGRTHQLRVHCAHREGLCNPIKGDRLYGQKGERLFLHAYKLSFDHPATLKRLTFSAEPEF